MRQVCSHLVKRGHNISVFMPLYKFIPEQHDVRDTGLKTWVMSQNDTIEFGIYFLEFEGIKVYFLENEFLFGRYGISSYAGQYYSDNNLRFSAFCRGCMNFIAYSMPDVQILNSYNWQTALIPVYNNIKYGQFDWKTVHCIYDVSKQGIFSKFSIDIIGLPWDVYNIDQLEFYDNINFMKGAILNADAVVSVSMSQAESFLCSSSAFRLEGVFNKCQEKLSVITNGIDYEIWDPKKDPFIIDYLENETKFKNDNKRLLCDELNLSYDKPLFCVVGEFLDQKGAEFLKDLIPNFYNRNLNLILYCNTKPDFFDEIISKQSDNVRIFQDDNVFFHKLIASADFVFMPYLNSYRNVEKYMAMRYGAIPIEKKFLDETSYDEEDLFTYTDIDSFWRTVDRAVDYFSKDLRWEYISKIMSINCSWELTARKYENLYRDILEE